MKNEIGIIIMSGCNGMLGVSKKAIEALGKPKNFCLYINVEKRQLAITPGCGSSSAVDLSKTSETQDYYWMRGLTIQRIISTFELNGECKLVYFSATHVTDENAITCSLANSVEHDLTNEDVSEEIKKFVYANFQLKDRKNRVSPNALDIKCCKLFH